MLQHISAFSGFSVDNLEKAKTFYSTTLGLTVTESPQGLGIEIEQGVTVFAYPKPNHIPATFTILNFMVPDIDIAVDGLIKSGITFEQYDEGYLKTDAKGVCRGDGSMGPKAIAWFKDPAGNILSLIQEK